MFNFNGFTQKASNAINIAIAQASALGHTYIGSEHILLGLISEGSGCAYNLLALKGIRAEAITALLVGTVGRGMQSMLTPSDLTPCCKRILEGSVVEAKLMGRASVGTEHLLMALLKEKDSCAVRFIRDLGSDPAQLYKSLIELINEEMADPLGGDKSKQRAAGKNPRVQGAGKTQLLDKYSRDLTDMAAQHLLDPVIGRASEIERVIQILSRRTKNNPCLIGEAGVGKTAVIEGLAQRIVSGEVPMNLREKRLVTLDLTGIVAGTKYRGDFEERIKGIIAEVTAVGNILLFVDEIHNIMGMGSAEGAVDAANILKPQLSRGEIQLIGATTIDEYRKHIEKDSALERRFQSVMINEPSEQDAMEILMGLREKYETHHRVKITDGAVKAAVTLSSRYISDRYLPDKAIDLIDEAASHIKLKTFTAPDQLYEAENKLKGIKHDKEAAINAMNFELAANLRTEEEEVKERYRQLKERWEKSELTSSQVVTPDDIALMVSQATGIEVTSLTREQSDRLLALEDEIHGRIIGQNEAVNAVARAIRRGRVGLKDPGRPVGSFIFLGPTGVGKTELCKALSTSLFGSEQAMIRMDMSEYMEKHTVSKLIGSPPGYVGYDDGGQLTERVRRKPYSVVLFDEIEKAHPDVFNILLQILEDGMLTDSQGRTVSFKNTVVIMTSNIGARYITDKKSFGFSGMEKGSEQEDKAIRQQVLVEVKQLFKPEFLNRVDEIIVFHRLSHENVVSITEKMFIATVKRLCTLNITMEYTKQAVERIAEEGFDNSYGARPLRRTVQTLVEDRLADEILRGSIRPGDKVLCDYHDGNFAFEKSSLVMAATQP